MTNAITSGTSGPRVDHQLTTIKKGKGKGRTLDIAPQVDIATTKVLRYMARTKQRRTYLPYTFQLYPVLIYRPREDGGLSKPRPRVQRATGPRLLHDSLRRVDSNPRPRGRSSSALTTRPSRHPENHHKAASEDKTCDHDTIRYLWLKPHSG